jgi:hypothetical protein
MTGGGRGGSGSGGRNDDDTGVDWGGSGGGARGDEVLHVASVQLLDGIRQGLQPPPCGRDRGGRKGAGDSACTPLHRGLTCPLLSST